MRDGILLAREIVVNATIVPATGLTIPPHPCSGFRSGNALQDQLQHELAAEERQHQQRHRHQRPPHRDHPAPTASPATQQQCAEYQPRSEEHTSELQSLMRISYAVFCLKKKKTSKVR